MKRSGASAVAERYSLITRPENPTAYTRASTPTPAPVTRVLVVIALSYPKVRRNAKQNFFADGIFEFRLENWRYRLVHRWCRRNRNFWSKCAGCPWHAWYFWRRWDGYCASRCSRYHRLYTWHILRRLLGVHARIRSAAWECLLRIRSWDHLRRLVGICV